MPTESELVATIVEEMTTASDVVDRPWYALVLVAEIDVRHRVFGYCFWDDDWEAATPDGFDALLAFRELAQVMREQGSPWRHARAVVRRADPSSPARLELTFDEHGEGWPPDPADPRGFAFGLLRE